MSTNLVVDGKTIQLSPEWMILGGVDKNGKPTSLQSVDGKLQVAAANSLPDYDSVEFDPPALPTTITYKNGSTTVAVYTLTYSGSDVATFTRTT